jgi:hypothetical protein
MNTKATILNRGSARKNVIALLLFLIAVGCGKQPGEGGITAEVGSNLRPQNTRNLDAKVSPGKQGLTLTNWLIDATDGVGTTQATEVTEKTLLSVWYSTNSTPEERVGAVTKLIPHGASVEYATALLGEGKGLAHYYGPSTSFIPEANNGQLRHRGSEDLWELQYQSPSGSIALRFELKSTGSNSQLGFEKAYSTQVGNDGRSK